MAEFDRTEEDLGNIVELGHVNTRIPDQRLATLFYVSGLGLTRDPFMSTGIDNMWINAGTSQFHLPTGVPQVLAGVTGLAIPGRDALLGRFATVAADLAGTQFSFRELDDCVETVSPWGNRIRVHDRHGDTGLGMPYVAFDTPPGTLAGLLRFYREALGAHATLADDALRVTVSRDQALIYRETEAPIPDFDGNHIQITLHDFSIPHRWLRARGLITQESDQHQYRFQDLVDPDTGKRLIAVEHETRSLRHPLYNRPLINRNPGQTQRSYARGRDAWTS